MIKKILSLFKRKEEEDLGLVWGGYDIVFDSMEDKNRFINS